MENHALTDQFFKSWVFAFLIGAVVIGALQVADIVSLDRISRQAPIWAALAVLCCIDPALRYFGVLKAEIEQRWADFTVATLLGRAFGALVGGAFAWGISVLGR
ncbi:hypothetical protein [Caballeronia insecticola]|uniref:Transmembrane protein n=1 Tax=Caballeronia insecticola TaxID=758793 RepID=R4WNE0_9BURK|nr:hypothetical protein [Caballeronia insecticola]BAN26059.1 hypothetical protein BRPE64_BCDS13980 [Caballeronia insecticola]